MASHAALVTEKGPADAPEDFTVLDVGWRVRERRISSFRGRQWVVLRPRNPKGKLVSKPAGQAMADDLVSYLLNEGVLGSLYPWWKLFAYLFSRDTAMDLLRAGPRQVCSVITGRCLVSHGIPIQADGELVDTPEEVRSLTPGDLEAWARRDRWRLIAYNVDPALLLEPGSPALAA